jgi:putative ABC transport system permease protein
MFGIIAGILFAVVLIGQQLSIFSAMVENMKGLPRHNPDKIWVINPLTQSTMQLLNIDVRVGNQLQSFPGVRYVYPIVVVGGTAKSPTGTKISVQIIGLKSPDYVGAAVEFTPNTNLNTLLNADAVIMDVTDTAIMNNMHVGVYFTINDKRVYLSGLSIGMTGFGASYVITTAERARQLSGLDASYVNAYLLDIDTAQQSKAAIISAINTQMGHVRAVEGRVLSTETLFFMLKTSNIAVSFGMMVLFATVAGFAIVGLTLYSSVNDRIRDYGTIKAIGGSNSFLRKLILLQALMYATAGFGVSYGLLLLMQMAFEGGRLNVVYPAWLIALLIGITASISLLSSLIAMRKIVKLEPVEIFRM